MYTTYHHYVTQGINPLAFLLLLQTQKAFVSASSSSFGANRIHNLANPAGEQRTECVEEARERERERDHP